MDSDGVEENEVLVEFDFNPGQGGGIQGERQEHPNHFSKGVAPVKFKNEPKPSSGIVENHGCQRWGKVGVIKVSFGST